MDAVAPGSTWSAFGVGAGAMETMYAAIAMGGNIRVGMEDNVLYRKGELAVNNMQFVARARRIIEEFTCEVATPAEAREMLGLAPRADFPAYSRTRNNAGRRRNGARIIIDRTGLPKSKKVPCCCVMGEL
jgi:hypothetical protein